MLEHLASGLSLETSRVEEIMGERTTIHLLDGHGYIFRAYFAVRRLSNSKGVPTNATLGFTNMIRKLLREQKPDYVVAAFDPPGPTLRHEAFEDYKASRDETPQDLLEQLLG